MDSEKKQPTMAQVAPGQKFYVRPQWEKDRLSAPEHTRMEPNCKGPSGQPVNAMRTSGPQAGTVVNVPDDVVIIPVR